MTPADWSWRLREARMQSPTLDALIIGLKALVVVVLFSLVVRALTGCGLGEFGVGDPASVPDGGDAQDDRGGETSLADAAGDTRDATPIDALVDGSLVDTSAADSSGSVDTGLIEAETGPACCSAPTAACSYPLASCPIASENHGSFPSSFEVFFNGNEYCVTVTTPSACLCNYTCACVVPAYMCAGGFSSCSDDPIQGLLITCNPNPP